MSVSSKPAPSRKSGSELGSGTSSDAPPSDLLTVSEAARLLRLSRRSIERLASRGVLPFYACPSEVDCDLTVPHSLSGSPAGIARVWRPSSGFRVSPRL